MVFLTKRAKKSKNGQNWSKMAKNDDFLVFLGDFPKSSKKNFIFALIRPFFWGVHSPWNRGSFFGTFGSRPYENLYYVYRFAYYLVTPFFSPPGGPGGPRKKMAKIVIFEIFHFFVIFGLFLAIFGLFSCFSWFWLFWCFWWKLMILHNYMKGLSFIISTFSSIRLLIFCSIPIFFNL